MHAIQGHLALLAWLRSQMRELIRVTRSLSLAASIVLGSLLISCLRSSSLIVSFSSGSLLCLLVGPSLRMFAHLLFFFAIFDDEIGSEASRLGSLLVLLILSHVLLALVLVLLLVATTTASRVLPLVLASSAVATVVAFFQLFTEVLGLDLLGLRSGKVAHAPVGDRRVVLSGCLSLLGSRRVGVAHLGLLVHRLHLILGRGCLGIGELLVVTLVHGVELSGSGVPGAGHLLPHHLLEGAALTGHLECPFRSLGLLFLRLSDHGLDIRLLEGALRVGLPLSIVEDLELHRWIEQLLADGIEDV